MHRSNKGSDSNGYFNKSSVNGTQLTNDHVVSDDHHSSDQEKVDGHLDDSQGIFRLLIDSAVDIIFIVDRDLTIKFVNRWGAKYVGKTPDEMIGKPLCNFFPPNRYAYFNSILTIFNSGNPISGDSVILINDQEYVLNTRLFPLIENDKVTYVMGISRDITKQKKIEREIKDSEEKFRSIIEQSSDGIILSDEKGIVIEYNKGMETISGISRDECIGKAVWEGGFFRQAVFGKNGKLANHLQGNVQEFLRTGRSGITGRILDSEIMRPDGTRRATQIVIFPIKTQKGYKICGIARDITDLQQANEQRSFLAAIVESSNDAIIGKTLDCRITSWNAGAERIYGYSADEVLGRPISILVPKDKTDEIPGIIERIRNGEPVDNFETIRVRKDGKRIDISLTVSPIKDSRGNIVGASTIAHDITKHKQVETALKKSERYYHELVDLAQEGIWAVDDQAYTIYVNPRMAEMLGYTVDKMLNKQIFYFMDKHGKELARKHLDKRELGVKEVFDFEFIKKDGSKIYTLMNSAPIINEYGGFGGSVSFVTDITNKRMAEKDLVDAKMQSDLYLDLMAQDIHTMNQDGKRYLELALHMQILDDDSRSMIQRSLSIFESSSKLIENLKKLQNVKSGKSLFRKMDLCRVLLDIQSHYARTPDKIKIDYEPKGQCIVQANEMLYDVFSNMLDHLILHSKKVPWINIYVGKINDDGHMFYMVAIEDRNHCIPEGMTSQIINEYLERTSNIKGTDIGMYLVKTLIEDYRGKIWAEDRIKGNPGKGCRFIVQLPVGDQ